MTASHPAFYSASAWQLDEFDTIIDVRSPAEFDQDHIPRAINCPVLDDHERALMGTTYTQVSPFEARKLGAALVARNIARHLEGEFSSRLKPWRPLVYCWRGGQRSAAMVTVLGQIGWGARQLEGGYKAFRGRVITDLAEQAPQLRLFALHGPTGSGKTALLAALAAVGEQVLDLEELARHRGSVLGAQPGSLQPAQRAFETALWQQLAKFDRERPVWVEAEARRIGKLSLPDALFTTLHAAPRASLEVPLDARVTHLCEQYAAALRDTQALRLDLDRLAHLHGRSTIARWKLLVDAADWRALARDLVERHYDPAYRHASRTHPPSSAPQIQIALADLSPTELARVARALAARASPVLAPAPV